MEPVHGGRDDLTYDPDALVRCQPQWSPSTEDGTTPPVPPPAITRFPPQWSPSTEDGTTPEDERAGGDRPRAAMEPVHGGRDDLVLRVTSQLSQFAAMEPVHGGRDDLHPRRQ